MPNQYEINLGPALKEAWEIFTKAPEVFVVLALAVIATNTLLSAVPGIGTLICFAVSGLAPGAFFIAANEVSKKGKTSFEALRSLPNFAPQLLTLALIKWVLVLGGLVVFVVPGVYFFIIFSFADFFVVQEEKNFMEALRGSRALVKGHGMQVLGLLFCLLLLGFSGLLVVGIGVLLTGPLAILTLFCVYQKIRQKNEPEQGLLFKQ